MKFLQMRKGRFASLTLACLFVAAGLMAVNGAVAQEVRIDLDRSTPAVDDLLAVTPSGGSAVVQGSVVVTGASTDSVKDHAIEVAFTHSGGGDSIDCTGTTFSDGEITSAFGNELCAATFVRRSKLFVNPGVPVGGDGVLTLFNFDVEVIIADGQSISLAFSTTSSNPQLGITVNDAPRTFGAGTQNPINTFGATITGGEPTTPSPTPTEPPATFTPAPDCDDSGYYILDSLGGRHAVGADVVRITGPLYYGRDVARDMENVHIPIEPQKGDAPFNSDLAVLDSFGAVQFVENPSAAPVQMFYFPENSNPAAGYAVDVEVASDSEGFWVLTEAGGIFRAGSALPGGQDAQLGGDAQDIIAVLNIPFGGSVPRDPNVGDDEVTPKGKIRAVGFVVVQGGDPSNPTGYVVLDSQGGHYTFNGAGDALNDGVANSILSGDTVYPFFRGLDIARDIELHPAGTNVAGLVIYDGWGGIHPVPVGFDLVNDPPLTQVAFLRNEAPAQTTTVGLPYIVAGFDDTGNAFGFGQAGAVLDADSIFRDLEFCASTGGDGIYVLDAFGGVFAFGNTRAAAEDVTPRFTGGPYFFPNKFARDLEPQTETEFETDFNGILVP